MMRFGRTEVGLVPKSELLKGQKVGYHDWYSVVLKSVLYRSRGRKVGDHDWYSVLYRSRSCTEVGAFKRSKSRRSQLVFGRTEVGLVPKSGPSKDRKVGGHDWYSVVPKSVLHRSLSRKVKDHNRSV